MRLNIDLEATKSDSLSYLPRFCSVKPLLWVGADGGVLTGAGGAEAGGLSVISVAITIGISEF